MAGGESRSWTVRRLSRMRSSRRWISIRDSNSPSAGAGRGGVVDGPADDRQEPLAAGVPRGLGGGQRGVVAGVFAELVDDPVGQVDRRVEEEDAPHEPLDGHDPEVAPADVGQLVEQDPVQLLGGQAVVEVGRHHDGRPEQAADGGRGHPRADGPPDRRADPGGPPERLEVDREPARAVGDRQRLADQPAGGHDRPDEPGQRARPRRTAQAEHQDGRGRERRPGLRRGDRRAGRGSGGRAGARASGIEAAATIGSGTEATTIGSSASTGAGGGRSGRRRSPRPRAPTRPGGASASADHEGHEAGIGTASLSRTSRNSPWANWADIRRRSGSQIRTTTASRTEESTRARPMNDAQPEPQALRASTGHHGSSSPSVGSGLGLGRRAGRAGPGAGPGPRASACSS